MENDNGTDTPNNDNTNGNDNSRAALRPMKFRELLRMLQRIHYKGRILVRIFRRLNGNRFSRRRKSSRGRPHAGRGAAPEKRARRVRRSLRIFMRRQKLDLNGLNGLNGNCSICLEALSKKREVSAASCGHVFCTPCINEELKIRKICPNCRKTLYPSKVLPLFL